MVRECDHEPVEVVRLNVLVMRPKNNHVKSVSAKYHAGQNGLNGPPALNRAVLESRSEDVKR